jgi:hypothetical protein
MLYRGAQAGGSLNPKISNQSCPGAVRLYRPHTDLPPLQIVFRS